MKAELSTDLAAFAWCLLILGFVVVLGASGLRHPKGMVAGYASMVIGGAVGSVVLSMEED